MEAIELLTQYSQNFSSTYEVTLSQDILGEVTFRFGKHLSSALTRLIQTCAFHTTNLHLEPEKILTYLTPFAFLTHQETTTQYNEIVEGCATVMREVAVGIDSTKQKKMPSMLYVGGLVSTYADFVATGANMLLLFMLALKEPINGKPILSQFIEKLVSKTCSQSYRRLIQCQINATNGNIYLIPHLINEMSELIAATARTACSSDVQTARKDNDMTKATTLYALTSDFCNTKLSSLETILASGTFHLLSSMPAYYPLLSPNTSLTNNSNPTSAGGTTQHNNGSAASPPRKKGKHEPTSNNNGNGNNNNSPINNSNNNNNRNNWSGGNGGNGNRSNTNAFSPSQLGMIKTINKPATWVPKIPATFTGTRPGNPASQKICPAFITVGLACTTPGCNSLHVTSRNFQSLNG
jgi:hypothetical protein